MLNLTPLEVHRRVRRRWGDEIGKDIIYSALLNVPIESEGCPQHAMKKKKYQKRLAQKAVWTRNALFTPFIALGRVFQ